jgi:hypothetical protein
MILYSTTIVAVNICVIDVQLDPTEAVGAQSISTWDPSGCKSHTLTFHLRAVGRSEAHRFASVPHIVSPLIFNIGPYKSP